jgi:hypothetical protein
LRLVVLKLDESFSMQLLQLPSIPGYTLDGRLDIIRLLLKPITIRARRPIVPRLLVHFITVVVVAVVVAVP